MTDTKRMPISVSSAVYIFDNKGKILLLKHICRDGVEKWGPPAGGIEPHETPLDTAIRETYEEIGLKPTLKDIIGIYTLDRGDNPSGIGFNFRGTINGEIKLNEFEACDYKYVDFKELKELYSSNKIYKPEYATCAIRDILLGNSYPLTIINPLMTSVRKYVPEFRLASNDS